MNKFTVTELNQLIEAFKNEPILWNRPKYVYTNATPERQDMIENVAKNFKRTPGEIEKCWVALREKYRRERGSELANLPKKYKKERWDLMDKLSFLDEIYVPSKVNITPQESSTTKSSRSKQFHMGDMVKLLPSTSGDNVIIRRVSRRVTPGVPGELVGVGKLKLANLADLQKKPNSPKSAEHPDSPDVVQNPSSPIPPIIISPFHDTDVPSDATRSVRSPSPAISIASSAIFSHSPEKHENGMSIKLSQNSRTIRKMENERTELLAVLKNLTREKSAAESYGEYLTKKLKTWSAQKQNKAIRMFNKTIAELEEDDVTTWD